MDPSVRSLRRRFIIASALAVLLVMGLVLGLVSGYNYRATYRDLYRMTDFIASHNGVLPEEGEEEADFTFTQETPFQLRYFSVWLDEAGNVTDMNLDHIHAISEEEARLHARAAVLLRRRHSHFVDDGLHYCYSRMDLEGGGSVISFMDCTGSMEAAVYVIQRAMMLGFFCLIFFILILYRFSSFAIRPAVRNMMVQKQFVTNAGHELKTPLTIISANTEVMEMMYGESEWTKSTLSQIERMKVLIERLTSLAKLQEQEEILLEDVDASFLAREAVSAFSGVMQSKGLAFESEIEDGVMIRAEKNGIQELLNILLDNAAKYCDEGGTVRLALSSRIRGTGLHLTVSNSYAEGQGEDFSMYFERFYRADASHNSQKSGYGIGLAMARSLAERYKGRISASWKNGDVSFTVLL